MWQSTVMNIKRNSAIDWYSAVQLHVTDMWIFIILKLENIACVKQHHDSSTYNNRRSCRTSTLNRSHRNGFLLALFFAIQLHLHLMPVNTYFYRMTYAQSFYKIICMKKRIENSVPERKNHPLLMPLWFCNPIVQHCKHWHLSEGEASEMEEVFAAKMK